MPVTSRGRWFTGLHRASRFDIAPKIYGTTTTETAGNIEDAIQLQVNVGAYSFLRTNLTGSNNDIDFVAQTPGDQSAVTVRLLDPSANNASLSVAVASNAITASLATGVAGAITSTAAQVIAAINAHATASTLVSAVNAPSNDGTGVVIALAATNLINQSGTSPTADVTMTASVDGTTDFFNILTIPQMTTQHAFYKRMTGPLPLGGTARATITIGGTATPLLAIGIQGYATRMIG